jgi:hypothetical protein
MKNFFGKKLRKLRGAYAHSPYPPAWPLSDASHARPQMNSQQNCPLFKQLSGELRAMIYQAVLTNPQRFLHIIRNVLRQAKRKSNQRRVAHYWCEDMASPFPTWQHSCYGESVHVEPGKYTLFCPRSITETSDGLLSLLLTCRLM